EVFLDLLAEARNVEFVQNAVIPTQFHHSTRSLALSVWIRRTGLDAMRVSYFRSRPRLIEWQKAQHLRLCRGRRNSLPPLAEGVLVTQAEPGFLCRRCGSSRVFGSVRIGGFVGHGCSSRLHTVVAVFVPDLLAVADFGEGARFVLHADKEGSSALLVERRARSGPCRGDGGLRVWGCLLYWASR